MRHRFHSICPYFAMFPETFVEKHLAATKFQGVVFDPFCGRGTTVFESLIRDRDAAGCDVHPVAVCVASAKSNPPTKLDVADRLSVLQEASRSYVAPDVEEEFAEFFSLCFELATFEQIQFLRSSLNWQDERTDRFIAALALGALHGESHRSPNYFSNRMPRTISTKPGYSVRWWLKNGYTPPPRDVFAILKRMNEYRFRTEPPNRRGEVILSDARDAADNLHHLVGQVTDVITSPPYLNTTNYREDQWLRLWFLGNEATAKYPRADGRHYSVEKYWAFLSEAWGGIAPLLASEARIVVRIGGRELTKEETRYNLERTLRSATGRGVDLMDVGVTSPVEHTQANTFRGSKPTPTVEHDFSFIVN